MDLAHTTDAAVDIFDIQIGRYSFEEFEEAILTKLEAEITDCDPASDPDCGGTPDPKPVGEPTTLLTAGFGLFMLAGLGRHEDANRTHSSAQISRAFGKRTWRHPCVSPGLQRHEDYVGSAQSYRALLPSRC